MLSYELEKMVISPINAVKIVTLVQQGASQRQIAQQLNVSSQPFQRFTRDL